VIADVDVALVVAEVAMVGGVQRAQTADFFYARACVHLSL
jgi:hypothetical protein